MGESKSKLGEFLIQPSHKSMSVCVCVILKLKDIYKKIHICLQTKGYIYPPSIVVGSNVTFLKGIVCYLSLPRLFSLPSLPTTFNPF